MTTQKNREAAVLILRLVLGFIFLMQGYGKVFSMGVGNVYQADFFLGTYEGILPKFLIKATAYFTSYAELIGGLLLVVGWKRDMALYLLGTVLIVVTFGHGLATPIWDLSHVLFRLIPLVALLLLPLEWDRFTLDCLLKRTQK